MARVLIAYANSREPMRRAVEDHLYSFGRYSHHDCHYFNFLRPATPRWLRKMQFDHLVLHTTFLAMRWSPEHLARAARRLRALELRPATVIAYPQDEFIRTQLLSEVLAELGVTHVFSVSPASEWPKIYPTLDASKVQFRQVLTGYVDDSLLEKAEQLARRVSRRDIDIGYRAGRAAPWLGRLGRQKVEIGERFLDAAPTGLKLDISTNPADVFLGDQWIEFLVRCRFVLGTESGASIIDPTGELQAATEAYLRVHPAAPFEDVERACFPGADGSLDLHVISPRHLEACATRTCQVLIRGTYSGLLEPDVHYVALEPDYSNIDDVVATVRDDELRQSMVDRAYAHVVGARRCTYPVFVAESLDATAGVVADPSSGLVGASTWERQARRDEERARRRLLRRSRWSERASKSLQRLGVRLHADTVAQIPVWLSRVVRGQQRISIATVRDRLRGDRGTWP